MTRQRAALYLLLGVVAAAAAVLSFAALRDLALLCGFGPELAWLLPVVLDAGAAAGSIVWLAGWTPPGATSYGRLLAMLLLGSSVGGNALGHGLEAYGSRPHWLVVVGVSAIAPTVLGALVHLVVLVGRPPAAALLEVEADDLRGHPDRHPERVGQPLPPAPDGPIPARAEAAGDVRHAIPLRESHNWLPIDRPHAGLGPDPEGPTETLSPWGRAEQAARASELGELPDRRDAIDTSRDAAIIADLRALESAHGRRWVRDEVKAMYGMGSTKAERVLTFMGWMPRDLAGDARADGDAS